ncbi:MAG: GumC family protein [Hyphomicrobiaceae bacterium]
MATHRGTQDIDVASIWSGVRRALPGLMICTIAAGVVTFAVLSLMAKRFDAETQLTITAKPTNPFAGAKNNAGNAATVTPRLDPAAINTHVRALMAPDLLIQVGKSLKLGERAEFNAAIGPVDALDGLMRMVGIGLPRQGASVENSMLAAMRRNLTVSSARQSRFISIRFTSTDPQVAANVANGIATAYRNSLREIPVRETNEAVAVLLPKIEKLSREVLEAEAVAKRFRAETDQLTGGATPLTLEQQRSSALNAELVKVESETAKSEARLAAARELAGGGSADTLPEVQQSRIIQDLIAQRVRVERQVNEARAVLLPAHPRMRQLNADLRGLRRAIEAEIGTIVSSIAKEVRLGQLRSEKIRVQLAELKRSAVSRSGDEAKLRSLDNTAKSKRNELERLQQQLEDNRTVVDTNRVPVESTIVSVARPSSKPVFPRTAPYTLLVMVATLMLGLALVIARELLATGRSAEPSRSAAEPARASERDKPAVPEAQPEVRGSPSASASAMSASLSAPGQPAAAGRNMSIPDYARHFIDSAPVEGGFRLLIAGAGGDIDPSDEATDLVAELSDSGARVLLVDWSLDGRPLHTDIDTDGAASLVDLMAGNAEFDDILVTLPDSNVHYAYSTTEPGRPELSDEDSLNLILDALDEAYDHVIVAGRYDDARALFEAIQGRFDAGMTVAQAEVGIPLANDSSFLGFDVADIEIIHYVRSVASPAARQVPTTAQRSGASQRT